MSIRVKRTNGDPLSFRRSVQRLIGSVIAAISLFAGYLLILVDDRRRGLNDRLAGTVVVFLTEEERRLTPRPFVNKSREVPIPRN